MTNRSREDKQDSNNNCQSKRKKYTDTTENTNLLGEDSKKRRQQRIELLNKRKAKQISNIHDKHTYLSTCCGMVNFSPEYIQNLKESYPEKSYLGKPDYKCKHCDAIFWINERNEKAKKSNNKEVVYSNCCKNEKKSKSQNSGNLQHILKIYLIQKVIKYVNTSSRKSDSIIACSHLHQWVQTLTKKIIKEMDPMYSV